MINFIINIIKNKFLKIKFHRYYNCIPNVLKMCGICWKIINWAINLDFFFNWTPPPPSFPISLRKQSWMQGLKGFTWKVRRGFHKDTVEDISFFLKKNKIESQKALMVAWRKEIRITLRITLRRESRMELEI